MEAENEQCDKGAIKHRRRASPQVVECKKYGGFHVIVVDMAC